MWSSFWPETLTQWLPLIGENAFQLHGIHRSMHADTYLKIAGLLHGRPDSWKRKLAYTKLMILDCSDANVVNKGQIYQQSSTVKRFLLVTLISLQSKWRRWLALMTRQKHLGHTVTSRRPVLPHHAYALIVSVLHERFTTARDYLSVLSNMKNVDQPIKTHHD